MHSVLLAVRGHQRQMLHQTSQQIEVGCRHSIGSSSKASQVRLWTCGGRHKVREQLQRKQRLGHLSQIQLKAACQSVDIIPSVVVHIGTLTIVKGLFESIDVVERTGNSIQTNLVQTSSLNLVK